MSVRKRGRALLVAGVAVAAAGGTAAAVTLDGGDSGTAGASTLPPATAQVQRSTLTDTETVDGTLGYGTETAVTPASAAPSPGCPRPARRSSGASGSTASTTRRWCCCAARSRRTGRSRRASRART
ncbi:hypothetical protein ACFQ1L_27940 [Phytohabitans flavus]|uniref:hypothetical protein n=1 Tax=Phytohabitans flavus TaxID=1076124 RepID=UPI003625D8A6